MNLNTQKENHVAVVKRPKNGRTPWRRIYSCIEPESLLYPGPGTRQDWDTTLDAIRRDFKAATFLSVQKASDQNNKANSARLQPMDSPTHLGQQTDSITLQNHSIPVVVSYSNGIQDLSRGNVNKRSTRRRGIDLEAARRRRHTVSRIELLETKNVGDTQHQVMIDAGVESTGDTNQTFHDLKHTRNDEGNNDVRCNQESLTVPGENICNHNQTVDNSLMDTGGLLYSTEKRAEGNSIETGFTTMPRGSKKTKSEVKIKSKKAKTMDNPAANRNTTSENKDEVKDGDSKDQSSEGQQLNISDMADIEAVVADLIDGVVSTTYDNANGADLNGEPDTSITALPKYNSRRESEPLMTLSQRERKKIFKNTRKNQETIPENFAEGDGFKRLFQMVTTSMPTTSNKEPSVRDFLALLQAKGIWLSDPRLQESLQLIAEESKKEDTGLNEDVFARICAPSSHRLIRRLLLSQMTIPGFDVFQTKMASVYQSLISELKTMNTSDADSKKSTFDPSSNYIDFMHSRRSHKPKSVSMSVCTVDGQRLSFGDRESLHPLDSCAHVINYCIACRRNGTHAMKIRIGKSPLLNSKDEYVFDRSGKIWNPFTKAGSIMTSAMLLHKESSEMQIEEIHEEYSRTVAKESLCCDNLSYNLKRLYAHEEISLAYFLSARQKLPRMCSPGDLLELHFQSSSTAATSDSASIAAATIANGGRCPLTDVGIFKDEIILHTLKRMRCQFTRDLAHQDDDVCYTYDESGTIFMVIPGLFGLVFFMHSQPRHTVKNIAETLVYNLTEEFNFSLYRDLKKKDELC